MLTQKGFQHCQAKSVGGFANILRKSLTHCSKQEGYIFVVIINNLCIVLKIFRRRFHKVKSPAPRVMSPEPKSHRLVDGKAEAKNLKQLENKFCFKQCNTFS